MKLRSISIFMLFAVFHSNAIYACMFDTDCQPGSACVKSGGNIYGFCMGGMYPGNMNDQQPAQDMLDITGKRGNTCQFDIDCGIGGRCVKDYGIYGTCM